MKVKEFKTEAKALVWVVEVRKAVANAPCDEAIRDQIRRAAASVLLNIAEGAGYPNPRSQARHYTIARASIDETLAGLRLLVAEHCLSDSDARTADTKRAQRGRRPTIDEKGSSRSNCSVTRCRPPDP
jgi:four helix bundle protein